MKALSRLSKKPPRTVFEVRQQSTPESADGSLASPALYSELHHIWAIDHTLMQG